MVTKYSVRYVLLFPWCGPDPKDTRSARCMSCNKSYKIDTMGKAAFISNEKSKGHQIIIKMQSSNTLMTHYVDSKEAPKTDDSTQNLCSINSTIVEPSERDPTICLNSIIPDTVCTPSRSAGATMKKYVLKEAVTKAEISWCFHTIATHSSALSAGTAASVFKAMFPDSDIAASFELGRTKIGYLITYGLAPYFSQKILGVLTQLSEFVVGFDESLNKIAQKQQMDIVVRYWCTQKNEVVSRYVGSAFLTSTRAKDLLQGLKIQFNENPSVLNNIIQISMDGPNVNFCLLKELNKEIQENRGDSSSPILSKLRTSRRS
ncbi:uncharacterized protein LOC129733946 [Wyeomyia smithii]|uniref:uncharacterized protein LOC129733946 n=1 Tax=Wyeomyia smithii TaxID=174621 RepID=UPI002467B028|nr:uncharacterized protein LOC129733946 [Wyeomyia smithii]